MTNPFAEAAQYFPTELQQTVYFDKYSRWRNDLGRREHWIETVDRATDFLFELSKGRLEGDRYEEIRRAMLEMKVMPSMRLLAMAGPAARRNLISLFNCSALPISDLRAFSEVMLLSMNGTGVGYSVERQFIEQLPSVARNRQGTPARHFVPDTTEGWAESLLLGLEHWWRGEDIEFDYSLVRPAGAILKTKGGRASGPEPLRESLNTIRQIVRRAQGRQLRPFEAHRIACLIASASISGGVRRSALIALFDADDSEMRGCKAGYNWWETYPELAYANNSAVIGSHVSAEALEGLVREMDANGTGEPLLLRWAC